MGAPPRTLQREEQTEAAYLGRLGDRVRAWRAAHAMTRKALALASGVSERYLAQLESGQGNISVLLLRKLAQGLGLPFIELDREVEQEAGAPLGELFSLYGQEAFRRFERKALARVLQAHPRGVIATGGSLVTDPDTYNLLLDHCSCVWLKATPEEHMQRVMAQGDTRPFKGSPAALEEIRRLLADRSRLYARADAVLDTSGRTVRQNLAQLRALAAKEA